MCPNTIYIVGSSTKTTLRHLSSQSASMSEISAALLESVDSEKVKRWMSNISELSDTKNECTYCGKIFSEIKRCSVCKKARKKM